MLNIKLLTKFVLKGNIKYMDEKRKLGDIYTKNSIVEKVLSCIFAVIFLFVAISNIKTIVIEIRMQNYNVNIQKLEKIKNEQGFSALKKINQNILAWVNVEDVGISLPIVKTSSNGDEDYYLNHDFYRKYNPLGTPFQKYDSNIFSTDNSVVVGHCQFISKNKNSIDEQKVFGSLENYLTWKANYNYKINLETENGILMYEIISAFMFDTNTDYDREFSVYSATKFDSKSEFDDFYSNILALSNISRNVPCEFGDKFLTLFTCWQRDLTKRIVVVAKKL